MTFEQPPPCVIDMRAVLVVLALAFATSTASAQEAPRIVEVKKSYRARLIAIDVLAFPLGIFTAGITWFAAAPITHMAHGNGDAAVRSLALRALPIAAGVIAYKAMRPDACDYNKHDCPYLAAFGVSVLTAAAVSIVDWAWLPVKTERRFAVPMVAPVKGGGIAGIGGAF